MARLLAAFGGLWPILLCPPPTVVHDPAISQNPDFHTLTTWLEPFPWAYQPHTHDIFSICWHYKTLKYGPYRATGHMRKKKISPRGVALGQGPPPPGQGVKMAPPGGRKSILPFWPGTNSDHYQSQLCASFMCFQPFLTRNGPNTTLIITDFIAVRLCVDVVICL